MRFWTKLLVGLITLGIIAGLVVFYIGETKNNQQVNTELQEVSSQLSSLENQKAQLEAQLQQLETDAQAAIDGTSVLDFLFTDISEEFLYNSIYPQFSELGWHGMIAVSQDAYPGKEGCISLNQAKKMLEDGWELCWFISEETDPEDWLDIAEQYLEDSDFEAPAAVYLPDSVYSADSTAWDQVLLKAGAYIKLSELSDRDYVTDDTVLDEIWAVNVCGWYDDNVVTNLDNAVELHNTMVLAIGGENDENSTWRYRAGEFTSLISVVQMYANDSGMQLMGIQEAYEYRHALAEQRENGETGMDEAAGAQASQLQAEIADLESQIAALDAQAKQIVGGSD